MAPRQGRSCGPRVLAAWAQNASLRTSMSSATPTRTISGRYLRKRACIQGGAGGEEAHAQHETVRPRRLPVWQEGRRRSGQAAPCLVVQVLGLDRKLLGILAQHVAHLRHPWQASSTEGVIARRGGRRARPARVLVQPLGGTEGASWAAPPLQRQHRMERHPACPLARTTHGPAAPPAPAHLGCCASSPHAPACEHGGQGSCKVCVCVRSAAPRRQVSKQQGYEARPCSSIQRVLPGLCAVDRTLATSSRRQSLPLQCPGSASGCCAACGCPGTASSSSG